MIEKRLLALILALYLLLGTVYALITPVFEASDELWHYPMIRHLADGNPLPVQVFDPAQAGPWKQEASQPPLYYYVGAALTFWVDASDMEQIRWLNPHVDNGVLTDDGNNNLAIHDPAASPWQGTLLAVRIVRLFSVLLGAVTVYLTYAIGAELAPDRPEIGLGAAAVNAFMPMFLFISGAVNNDNLAIPLASLAALLMIRYIGRRHAAVKDWLVLGLVIGLALLTKEGTFALLPLAWGTVLISRWQLAADGEKEPLPLPAWMKVLGQSILYFALLMLPVLLVAGWWYARNIQLYGDLLGWNAFIAVLGQRAQPASLAQLWDERRGFLMSYWGLFGGVNLPMVPWIYSLLNSVMLLSVAGFFGYLARTLKSAWHQSRPADQNQPHSAPALNRWLARLMAMVESRFALVVCLLFAAAVIYGLITWATTTWSSQGRLVFTAISALNVLMVAGLAGWLPRRPARWLIGSLAGLMFFIAAAAPFLWIKPAYDPAHFQPDELPAQTPLAVEFLDPDGGTPLLRLDSFSAQPVDGDGQIQPGGQLELTLVWRLLAPTSRDWSSFVHLNDPVLELPAAQRDMYPAQGLRPTSLLPAGEQMVSRYRLSIPETAVAPAELELTVGWYDFTSGQRLPVAGGGDAAVLSAIQLDSRPGDLPNPVSVNFGDQLELVGFQLAPRRAAAGDSLALALYWRPLAEGLPGYTFFAQVVDDDTTRWASFDLAPPEGTGSWPLGELQRLELPLALNPESPAGVYPIHLGIYTRAADGGFARLQLVSADGRITQEDFLLLTKVRVD